MGYTQAEAELKAVQQLNNIPELNDNRARYILFRSVCALFAAIIMRMRKRWIQVWYLVLNVKY